LVILFVLSLKSYGYVSYGNDIDGPLKGDCNVCHLPGDMTSLNSYGLAFENYPNHASVPADAIENIADLDSDGDGYMNGWELEKGTNPGDGASFPPAGTLPKTVISQPGDGSVFGSGVLITFNGSASNDEFGVKNGIASYDWDFGDGNSAQGNLVTHTYISENTYIVTLTVTSVGGLTDSKSASVIVSNIDVNVQPNGIIAGDAYITGSLGAPIFLDASESFDPNDDSDNNGLIDGYEVDNLTYTWDFGDGTIGSGKTVEHIYTSTGTFTVTLNVTDGGFGSDDTILSDTDSISIEVFRPTLQIVNFTKSSKEPVEGYKLVMYGKIRNIGEGDAINVTVRIVHEELVEQVLTNVSILSNETHDVVFSIYPEAGNHKYILEVDCVSGIISDFLYAHVDTQPNAMSSPGIFIVTISFIATALCFKQLTRKKQLEGGK
jgi:PKD repeat protein